MFQLLLDFSPRLGSQLVLGWRQGWGDLGWPQKKSDLDISNEAYTGYNVPHFGHPCSILIGEVGKLHS